MPFRPARSRRAFLGRLSTIALACTVPLAGCGGGGDAPPAPPGPPPAGTLDTAARLASLRAVEARCVELESQQPDPLARVHAIAAAMAQDPHYAETGVDAASLTAWGVFTDGRVHFVGSAWRPGPGAAAPASFDTRARAAAAKPPERPGSRHARLMHSFYMPFDGQPVIDRMSGWLDDHDYQVRAGTPGDARVTTLRNVQGDGFFYINTHGGVKHTRQGDTSSPLMFSIQSSTLVDAALETLPDFVDDFANARLTYFTAYNGRTTKDSAGRDVDARDTRYGVTAQFVDRYWQFAPDSIVLINACNSANTAANDKVIDFVVACHRKGAGLYLGWTEICSNPSAFDIPAFFMDRVLGVNEVEPESPKQRAFPGEDVIAHMAATGRTRDAITGAFFIAKPNPRSTVRHILTPAIRQLEVDELNDELRLTGCFGRDAGRVVIGGQAPAIVKWEPDEVVCRLPRTGAGSSGEVWVELGADRSNTRHLSAWTLDADLRWFDPEMPGLSVDGPLRVRWRADVGPVREACGQPPERPVRHAIATRDSSLALVAGGAFPQPPDCTVTWKGQASYPSQVEMMGGGSGTRVVFANLRIDTLTRRAAMGLAIGDSGDPPSFIANHCSHTNAFTPAIGLLDRVVEFEVPGAPMAIPLPAKDLDLAADLSIPAGGHDDDQLRLRWNPAAIASPPTADDRV